MSVYIGILILIIGMTACFAVGVSPVYALILGLLIFSYISIRQGNSLRSVARMCLDGAYSAKVVVILVFIVGALTASWRASGVIAYFVYYGIKIIQPRTFIIVAFVITGIMSYALGSSFAVAASMGVIFMSLARAGGVNEAIMGGVIMSAIYIGDRGAPSSSCAMLVASSTDTDHMDNVKRMFKSGLLPLISSFLIYCVFSLNNPIKTVDGTFLSKLTQSFTITHFALIPVAVMIVLPLLKFGVRNSMLLSLGIASALAIIVQKLSLADILKSLVLGYESTTEFGAIFNGGGLASMISLILIVIISSSYAGIFKATGMLNEIKSKIAVLMKKTGRYFTTLIVGMTLSAVTCNQSFATIMTGSLMGDLYDEAGAERSELASDIQNSFVILVAMLPWAIACTGALSFMGGTYASMKYAFYIYFIPLFYFVGTCTKSMGGR